MRVEEIKKKIILILNSDIKFEGHFNKCFINLKESQQVGLLNWIKNCKEGKINTMASFKHKNILIFIEKIGSNLRVVLTKEKNSYFLALFLDKHKYYEAELLRLGV